MGRVAASLVLTVIAAACGNSGKTSSIAPTAPTTVTMAQPGGSPSVQNGPYSIAGLITNAEDGRPIAGVNVSAWVQTTGFGYSYMWAHGAMYSDTTGHYGLPNVPESATVTLQVWKDGYVQQCAAPTLTMRGDVALNLLIISKPKVSAAASSVPPSAPGFRIVSGMVFETTSEGRHPLGGAFVDFEPSEDFPAAVTYSDGEGRYLLCGIPDATPAQLGASFGGVSRVAYVTAPPHQTIGIDIEIPPAR
jgi:hypothetical protein